jgi:predicted nucleotidyltransferase
MMNNMYDKILESFNVLDKDILAVYPYGSRIYGTATEASDYDFVVVLKNLKVESDQLDAADYPITINLYSEESFQDRLVKHRISTLECIFLPSDQILKEAKFYKLRKRNRKKQRRINNNLKRRLFGHISFSLCCYCQVLFDMKELTIEHIKPLCLGGTNDESNITLACAPCNQSKGKEVWLEIKKQNREAWRMNHGN